MTLIVRNSEHCIERSLDSVRPFVDGIFVFDTGSTDGTVELLRKLARRKIGYVETDAGRVKMPLAPITVKRAKPSEVPTSEDGLLGDFSWARDQSFAMVPEEFDFLAWMDDDDIVVGAQHLRSLASKAHPALDGYVMFYDYARDPETGANVCALWRERLLRRKSPEEWGWRNAVHEVWLPHEHTGLVPNYLMLPPFQVHYRHERPEGRYASTRNLRILERVVKEEVAAGREPDPRTKAYMGTELMSHGQFQAAVPWLNSYLEDGRTSVGDERSQVYHKLAICLRALGQPMASIEVEFTAIKERDDWAENAVGLAESFAEIGEWKRCETWAHRAIELGQPQSMLILNPLEFTLIPYVRIAQAQIAQKRYETAAEWIGKAMAIQPSNPIVLQTARQAETEGLRERAVQALLTLRELCVRFDENWKAHEILENAPYIVGDDARVVQARAMQRENVMHALRPDEYRRWYEDEPKETGVADDLLESAADHLAVRVKFLLAQAQQFETEHGRKPRMLDLGCNDGWMAAYLWQKGEFVCDGVELNKEAAQHAAERLARFGSPGRIVQGDIHDAYELLDIAYAGDTSVPSIITGDDPRQPYDIVSCFEVFEHVPDTDRLLSVMESLLTPDGIACVTTPNGAYEDGNLPMWQIVERKGHLRALTAVELGAILASRGSIENMIVHDEGRLTYAAWKPGRKKGKVIFYAPGAYEQWSAESINATGIGGSETCLIYLALGLAEREMDVRVYSDAKPGVIGNTIWRPSSAFDPTEEADAIIVSRHPGAFNVELHAPIRALWCHDATYGEMMNPRLAERMTDVICLSDWSQRSFEEQYPFLAGKTRVIRNGISLVSGKGDPKFPNGDRTFGERKPRCIYSSSADRGLDKLLEWWPRIRRIVPDAELHVFYGWETLDRAAIMRPDLLAFKAKILELLSAAGGEQGGIFMRGRIGQNALYSEMQEARVWSYPTYFAETSCIGAMEARAAGLALVTSDHAALHETVGEHGLLLTVGDSYTPELDTDYEDKFVGAVAKLLADEETWTRWHTVAREGIEDLTWARRLDDWMALVTEGARR